MATFYAKYPVGIAAPTSTTTVQGLGTPGVQTGGILTVQGDPSGTAIPVSGTFNSASTGATGAPVPVDATYIGASVAGTLTGLVATAVGLKVDGSAATQPVSGTVAVSNFPATQPVSGTVTANAGTGTFAVSAASLPLPTGAATETTLAKLPLAQASTTSGQSGTLVQGAVTTAAPSYTTAQTNPLSLTTAGALRVDASGSTQPVSGTVAATQSGTWNIGTVTTVTGVTTVSTVTAVTAITNALPAGTNAIGGVIATATAAATFQAEGSIAFGSMTNAYQTIFTPSASTKILQLRNNTNAAISVSFDAGTTLNYVLDAGDAVSLDLVTNGLIMSTTAIQVKYAVGAPTSGSMRVNGAH